jgi:heat shock protein 1/8
MLRVTHTRVEEFCQDLFNGTLEPVEKVLRDSKIDMARIPLYRQARV